jgi:small conductance mechanosensitive channel
MFSEFFNLNGSRFWNFLIGPVLAAVVWFALDYAVRRFYTRSSVLERLFNGNEKIKPFKKSVLAAIRILLGIYFIFILLDHFSVNSRPLLNLEGDRLWKLLTGPVLTVVIWMGLDYAIRILYAKSSFIERIFSRYARVKTFKGLLLQTGRTLIGIYFTYILLGHFNIDPKPLLAGIGVVGLGLSLAAQNILRDFLTGLFIIIEDQFNVGDWVTIGSFSGTVESFTMRVTRLRASDGKLIIIPNGNISEIVNSTKDFAVAVVEVGVAYGSDVRLAMEALEECGAEIMKTMPGVIVEEPNVLGIMAFRDSDLLLRITARTMPGEQWSVERAMRITIKEKFDEKGIEIPFQQVVIHRDQAEEKTRI